VAVLAGFSPGRNEMAVRWAWSQACVRDTGEGQWSDRRAGGTAEPAETARFFRPFLLLSGGSLAGAGGRACRRWGWRWQRPIVSMEAVRKSG
jgi:hypothetical protein